MDRFVSTYINKIDAKGRVSVPAPFRGILERDGYAGGIYCYPSLDAPALDAGGKRLAENIDRILDGLPDYSDERDELSVALYGDVHTLTIDQDGRIVLPEGLRTPAFRPISLLSALARNSRCGSPRASTPAGPARGKKCATTANCSARGAAS